MLDGQVGPVFGLGQKMGIEGTVSNREALRSSPVEHRLSRTATFSTKSRGEPDTIERPISRDRLGEQRRNREKRVEPRLFTTARGTVPGCPKRVGSFIPPASVAPFDTRTEPTDPSSRSKRIFRSRLRCAKS